MRVLGYIFSDIFLGTVQSALFIEDHLRLFDEEMRSIPGDNLCINAFSGIVGAGKKGWVWYQQRLGSSKKTRYLMVEVARFRVLTTAHPRALVMCLHKIATRDVK